MKKEALIFFNFFYFIFYRNLIFIQSCSILVLSANVYISVYLRILAMCASVCQSCMAPLESEIDFGTNEDGSKNRDYCGLCFRKGRFTDPNIPLARVMNEVTIHVKLTRNIDTYTARQIVENKMPTLKRWKKKEEALSHQ